MIGALLAILTIIAVGGRATDNLRVTELESILSRLPEGEARAYYALLRRRVRRIALMRALALVSLVCVFYTLRRWLVAPP